MATGTNVFISYASDTKPLAEELARALESQGIEPWVDFKDLQPGQRLRGTGACHRRSAMVCHSRRR